MIPSLSQLTRLSAISEARKHIACAQLAIRHLEYDVTERGLAEAATDMEEELRRLLDEPLAGKDD